MFGVTIVSSPGCELPSLQMQERARLGHGFMGWLAAAQGFDMLHIKGAAAAPELGREGRGGMDADVLVRPSQIRSVIQWMTENGWSVATSFESGSVFEHATTLFHEQWGTVDLHKFFPGIRLEPEHAFDRMWADRQVIAIAGQNCAVPSVSAQRLVVLIHAARSGHAITDPDVVANWTRLDESDRQAVLQEAATFDAQVALAAATGRLEEFRHDPEYLLWNVFAGGGSILDGWWARVRGARGVRAKARVIRHIAVPNTDQLTLRYGHSPTLGDVLDYYSQRALSVWREVRSQRTRAQASKVRGQEDGAVR